MMRIASAFGPPRELQSHFNAEAKLAREKVLALVKDGGPTGYRPFDQGG